MSALIAKIVSILTSIIMSFFSFFSPPAPPAEDPYARLDLPEYSLGECITSDAEETVLFYNAAVKKSHTVWDSSLNGEQKIKLINEIEGDGAIGTILKVAEPAIDSALKKNNFCVDYVPGKGNLLAEDVISAALFEGENGSTLVLILLKNQIDGSDSSQYNGGPVSRGIGTLGSVDHALQELGATIKNGRETVQIEYTNAYIVCEVDANGYILGGTWHYDVNVTVADAQVTISIIAANIKNLKGKLEYAIVLD